MDPMRDCRVPLSLHSVLIIPEPLNFTYFRKSINLVIPVDSSFPVLALTERYSAFLEHHLQPFVQALPSYIKDTNHFLSTIHSISDPLPPNIILVTVDVTPLYTNIPHTHGLAVLEHYLDTRLSPRKPSTPFLLQLAQFVLTMNNFTFENANLFMGLLETQYLNSTPLTPFTWVRYIDDIFLIWTHGQESLETFLQNLNCTFSVKFTWSFSRKHTTFLDVDIWLSVGAEI